MIRSKSTVPRKMPRSLAALKKVARVKVAGAAARRPVPLAVRQREIEALRRVVGADRKATVSRRLRFATILRRHLKDVLPCLRRGKDAKGRSCPVLVRNVGDREQEVVRFGRHLGSGEYGDAYVNTGYGGAAGLLRFSAKVTPTSQAGEVQLLEGMSRLVEVDGFPNMPITYKVLRCPKHCAFPGCPDIARDRQHFILLNELADGDLFSLFAAPLKQSQYESILIQAVLALRAFHSLGYAHNDAHLRNFLYHKVPAGGYWRYDVPSGDGRGKVPLFVPNRGHLVVLWDPGLAERIGRGSAGSFEGALDYLRIITSIAKLGLRVKEDGLKGPSDAARQKMQINGLHAAVQTLVENKGARQSEPLGNRCFRLVVRGIQEGRWLPSIRAGSRKRLPVRDLRGAKVRLGEGLRTLEETRTLAPSRLPEDFHIINRKGFPVVRTARFSTRRRKPASRSSLSVGSFSASA